MRLSTPNGPRTPLQTAKATGVIYSVPENAVFTQPPSPPRSPLKASPPKGIKGCTLGKNGKSPSQDVNKHEHSPGEQAIDRLQSPISQSRLRYAKCALIIIFV